MHHQRCRTTRSNLPLLLVCFAIIFSAAAGQVSRADDAASGFANPPMLSSRDGQLHVNRTAAPATYTINGHQFQGMLYNRSQIQFHRRRGQYHALVHRETRAVGGLLGQYAIGPR